MENNNNIDQSGEEIWTKMFGNEVDDVDIDTFIKSFGRHLIEKYKAKVPSGFSMNNLLNGVKIHNGEGKVTMNIFNSFVKLFGPLSDCLKNVAENVFTTINDGGAIAKWYHGLLPASDAKIMLKKKVHSKERYFLIRLSSSESKLVVNYMDKSGENLKQAYISKSEDGKFYCHCTAPQKVFDLLPGVISKQKPICMWRALPSERSSEEVKMSTPTESIIYGGFSHEAVGKTKPIISSHESKAVDYGSFAASHVCRIVDEQPQLRSISPMVCELPENLNELSLRLHQNLDKVKDNVHMGLKSLDKVLGDVDYVIKAVENRTSEQDALLSVVARALFLKGEILCKINSPTGGCLSYKESVMSFEKLFNQCEMSDSLSFDKYPMFAEAHRKLAECYVADNDVDNAVYHYGKCSGLILQDTNSGENDREELMRHVESLLPKIKEKISSSSDALSAGIAAYKTTICEQDNRDFTEIKEFLQSALTYSRIFGENDNELKAVLNLGTVANEEKQHAVSANFYKQYCMLLDHHIPRDQTTLNNGWYTTTLQLVKAGLYYKAQKCIENISLEYVLDRDKIGKIDPLMRDIEKNVTALVQLPLSA